MAPLCRCHSITSKARGGGGKLDQHRRAEAEGEGEVGLPFQGALWPQDAMGEGTLASCDLALNPPAEVTLQSREGEG
jgi:hypothetical protein